MKMKNPITILITTENALGVMQKVAAMFTRRRLNIESMAVSEAETKGLCRFTIVLFCSSEQADKLVKQMRKIVEVRDAEFFLKDDYLVYKEISFVRVSFSSLSERLTLEKIAEKSKSVVAYVDHESIIMEKSGHEEEIDSLLEALKGRNVTGFVRSGRIAIPVEVSSRADNFENVSYLDKGLYV